MSTNINTQNPTTANVIAAKKLKKNSSSNAVQAAKSLPKYSLYEELKKNDEFKKSVLSDFHLQQQKEQAQKNKLPLFKFTLATAFILFITRK